MFYKVREMSILINKIKKKYVKHVENYLNLWFLKIINLYLKLKIRSADGTLERAAAIDRSLKEKNLFNSQSLIYKDETWNRVVNRWEDRRKIFLGKKITTIDNPCVNNKAVFDKNDILIKSVSRGDDWIYIIEKRDISNFYLKIGAIFYTKFREIQFGFRHLNFYYRYRFRIEGGFVFFDIIYRGKFINEIKKFTFEPEVGREYLFEIIVNEGFYCFCADGEILISVKESNPLIKKGSYAIILWDPSEFSEIAVDYKNCYLVDL
ncbi:hypothetical protein [Geoalkalibacter halelectricus]|uniref:Uncharacterized protein n=1 Tax=Geoalkalibacter halelectricus TaxID=2847045 RepID=A0ABY5ZNI9_9BACT|nr:hypothetical protein [Geoalkalibacter halelectricus]MDO3379730.1 hypothetical protein [Geoalkalibacter halelectricus]UWZ79264.1 hypothetical protein L9S41_16515 [Geoalkalibacter halelectricus]